MTHFLDIARNRFSCRNFDPRPVEEEKLIQVLEAGRIAPSAVNFQPWYLFVIREANALQRFYSVYHREWFRTAPCVIVICTDHERSWKRKSDRKDHADIDAAITTDHMTLQATELGLATCWICNFDTGRTRELLKLPSHLEPVVILPLGYPLDQADPGRHSEKRKPLKEIVTFS
jgi:nitroreductase